MSTRDYTPEEIKNKLMDMLISGDKPITIRRSMVKAVRNYILLLERRQGDLIAKCGDPCPMCRHYREYTCRTDTDCEKCQHVDCCKCNTCIEDQENPGFAWRDDL